MLNDKLYNTHEQETLKKNQLIMNLITLHVKIGQQSLKMYLALGIFFELYI